MIKLFGAALGLVMAIGACEGVFAQESSTVKFPYDPNVEGGKYRNPVIEADYSDPDVCRVGEDFYMTASSFSCFPGLPILHSKDLVNWTIVGHAVEHYPEGLREVFKVPQHGGGVWAPAIRYHAGKFWIFFADPDHGIFMTTAEKAEGPWTPLHLVQKSFGWIDTCPFWDEDGGGGQAYLVHGFANSRAKLSNILWLHRMAADGTRLLDDGKLLFDARGIYTTVEGPKLYKRGGFYYVFAPGGGVTAGYQLVLRSKTIDGPYEHRIVLDSGGTEINGPHQGAWVDTPGGKEDWFVHFQELLPYGRITHLQPMRWVDDWPVIGEAAMGAAKGEPVVVHAKPVLGQAVQVPQTSDEFEGEKLGMQWQWWGEFREEWYSLKEKPGNLRLYAAGAPAGVVALYDRANLLLQKFPARAFTATAKVDVSHLGAGARAGLVLAGKTVGALQVEQVGDEARIVRTNFVYRAPPAARAVGEVKRFDVAPYGPVPSITIRPLEPFPAPGTQAVSTQGDTEEGRANVAGTTVYLRMTCDEKGVCAFSYSSDGKAFTVLGKTVTAANDTWIGAKVGVFCNSGAGDDRGSYVDVDWFRFE